MAISIPKLKVINTNLRVPKISVPKIGMVRMPNISYLRPNQSNIIRTKIKLK